MKALYDGAREGFLDGSIDADTHELRAVLLDAGYTVDLATHRVLADIPTSTRVATSPPLGSKTTAGGVLDAADVTVPQVTGDPVTALALYQHALTEGGTALAETAARLVVYVDEDTAGAALSLTPNGGDVQIVWSDTAERILAL